MAEYLGPDESLISIAKRKWSLEHTDLQFIRGNENWVYEVNNTFFRFTEEYHRNVSEIKAELDWIFYLAENGLSVARPIKSSTGNLVEEISETWCCVVFEKASGNLLKEPEHFSKEVFTAWGKLTGLIHRTTQSFRPGIDKRRHWAKDDSYDLIQVALKNMDEKHPMVHNYLGLLERLKSYSEDKNGFGLIHGDFHHGNFHYDFEKRNLTLFDFDDSNYFWYIFDLAVPFASLDLSKHMSGLNLDYQDGQNYFLDAYHKEYSLDDFWLKQLPIFIQYRFSSLYFWSKGRALTNRIGDLALTERFMGICEKLALSID